MTEANQHNSINKRSGEISPRFFEILTIVNESLSELSNKEARDLLTMVGSIRNLRVVSADRPIGLTSVPQARSRISRASFPDRTIVPKPATWKKKPEWLAAIAAHRVLVTSLKDPINANRRDGLLTDLRKQEAEMKTLKQSLQGFRLPS